MYHSGFKIDEFIYSIGGQGKDGKIYDQFVEIDIVRMKQQDALVEQGRKHLQKIYSSAITPVFYQSKMGVDGQLELSKIAGEINWGGALELIKYEGMYMFGGRLVTGEATNDLIVIQVRKNKTTHRASFKIDKPLTKGVAPGARYMHTINYIPKQSLVAIYGGRNDHMSSSQVYDDLWILKLFNMEYVKVQIGGSTLPISKFNHCSVVNGSQLIILGGQSNQF